MRKRQMGVGREQRTLATGFEDAQIISSRGHSNCLAKETTSFHQSVVGFFLRRISLYAPKCLMAIDGNRWVPFEGDFRTTQGINRRTELIKFAGKRYRRLTGADAFRSFVYPLVERRYNGMIVHAWSSFVRFYINDNIIARRYALGAYNLRREKRDFG